MAKMILPHELATMASESGKDTSRVLLEPPRHRLRNWSLLVIAVLVLGWCWLHFHVATRVAMSLIPGKGAQPRVDVLQAQPVAPSQAVGGSNVVRNVARQSFPQPMVLPASLVLKWVAGDVADVVVSGGEYRVHMGDRRGDVSIGLLGSDWVDVSVSGVSERVYYSYSEGAARGGGGGFVAGGSAVGAVNQIGNVGGVSASGPGLSNAGYQPDPYLGRGIGLGAQSGVGVRPSLPLVPGGVGNPLH